ncbi:MAG: c-type cytochrome [Acidobacteriota bacterium]|nr:c-type cytochrome [Acidobacteriota bacterium]
MARLITVAALLLTLSHCGTGPEDAPVTYTGDATPAWGPSNGNADAGRVLAEKLCATCHLVAGAGKLFPGAVPFEKTAARADVTTTYLRGWLANPMAQKPKTLMPNLGLTPQQIEDLIAYLYTLRPE